MDGICPGRRGASVVGVVMGLLYIRGFIMWLLGGVWQGLRKRMALGFIRVHGRLSPVHWLVSDSPWGFFDGRLYGHYEKKAIKVYSSGSSFAEEKARNDRVGY